MLGQTNFLSTVPLCIISTRLWSVVLTNPKNRSSFDIARFLIPYSNGVFSSRVCGVKLNNVITAKSIHGKNMSHGEHCVTDILFYLPC